MVGTRKGVRPSHWDWIGNAQGGRGSTALPIMATRPQTEEKEIWQGERSAARAASHHSEGCPGELPFPGVRFEGGCKSNLGARVH